MRYIQLFVLASILTFIYGCTIRNYTVNDTPEKRMVPPVPDMYDQMPMTETSRADQLNYRLPDGYILKIRVKNNARESIAETVDGFSIVLNPEGFYEYTIQDDQGLPQPTGIIARNPEDRTSEDWRILNSIP